ncbi:hypothetical protein Daus18300_004628 [Diaporthe australafricana]|uniref:Uncharacterized protein n=1 Tax=Diaporthe australafricana TaxID=127596 RepID=A0ABR3X6S3_9PEZI
MATNTKLNLKLPLPLPEFFLHKKSRLEPLPPTPEENEDAQLEDQELGEAAQDATEWIKSTIREQGRWEEHLSFIRIDCPHNMAELRQLGRLAKSEGTMQCRKMIRIPVLYDEIGCFLWERLAALERGPDFGKEDEKKAAEYARQVTSRAMLALDERFCFDPPPSTAASSITKRKGRARQDSEPISPKHIQQAHAESSHQPRPSISYGCHFCHAQNTNEPPGIPEDIRADALSVTRGRVIDQPSPSRGPQHQALSRAGRSISEVQQPAAFFNHSRRTSYSGSVLWQRDPASSTRSSSRSSSGSVRSRGSRDGSLAVRVGSVVGNLGRGVVTAIGGGLSHGYGYGGQADRNGSFRSV